MTLGEVLVLVAGWAAVAVPVGLVWGRGRCRHPQPGSAGAALAVPDRDEQRAPAGRVVVVVRHEHVVTVRHSLASPGPLPVGAVRPSVVVDGEVVPSGGRGWAR
ncbi:hypothetical protein ACFQE5_23055 [Pseudonocardia hispaniensis]|uniref:Uncharacterized protein n=1 Tax=Pseudonocardia hispaniensis TaxID=904933 RepID=A0ABW1J9I2_9PSEU